MKTITNKIELTKANDVTIILDTKNNRLVEVEYVRTIVSLDGAVTHIFKNNGKEYRVPENGRYRMFQSKKHFEQEIEVEHTGVFLAHSKTKGKFRFVGDTNGETVDIMSISFTNGVPAETDAPLTGFEIVMHRGYIHIKPIFDKDTNLDDYFDCIESATLFHDYVVVNKEGVKETVKGRCSFILPTDEQKPVVEELRAVIEKMRNAGLALMLDTSCGKLHVYNVSKAYIEYDGCEDEGVSLYRLYMPESVALPNPICDYCDDSNYRIYERKTNPEQ